VLNGLIVDPVGEAPLSALYTELTGDSSQFAIAAEAGKRLIMSDVLVAELDRLARLLVVRLPGGNLFFAGDTGMGDGQWPREAAAYGPIRLALIPIGAFRFSPGQMAAGSHIGPIDAAEVFDRLAASRGIGMHWGTFRLSYEGYDTPPKMLAAVMHCRGQSGFDTVAIGKPTEIAPYAKPVAAVRDFNRCLASPAVTALP
jgi:hypothetical protein